MRADRGLAIEPPDNSNEDFVANYSAPATTPLAFVVNYLELVHDKGHGMQLTAQHRTSAWTAMSLSAAWTVP